MLPTRSLLAIACLVLASCAPFTPATPNQVHFNECAGMGSEENTCVTVGTGPDQLRVCPVWVFERRNKPPIVYPYTLKTDGPTPGITTPKTVIVWLLRDGRFRNAADGPAITHPGGEFSGGTPSDATGLVGSSGPERNYRIRFLNSLAGTYKYTIKFEDSHGNELSCDPRINNSGG